MIVGAVLVLVVLALVALFRPSGPWDCPTCRRRMAREPWEVECTLCQIRYVER